MKAMLSLKPSHYHYKFLVHVVLFVSLGGMVSIYPFEQSYFRFSLSVSILSMLLLYFSHLPALITALLSGLSVLGLRSLIYLPLGMSDFLAALVHNFPAITYYFVFGICFHLLKVRQHTKQLPLLIVLLCLMDVFGNIAELMTRGEFLEINVEYMITSMVTMAVIRAIIAVAGYYGLKKYHASILAEDQLTRYVTMNVMVAELKTELFFLKKSASDIEKVMADSYELYQSLQSEFCPKADYLQQRAELSSHALSVARNIHEIKKDYYRVTVGIEDVLKPSTLELGIPLSEVFSLIKQNAYRNLAYNQRNISIDFHYTKDFTIVSIYVYTIVSILNNLLSNALEACSDGCKIIVQQYFHGENVVFEVQDDGPGIEENDFSVIFAVGYSTKFCPNTGKMSTGLGLSHAKSLTEFIGGTIQVRSQPHVATSFIVAVPISKLIGEDSRSCEVNNSC
jgi:two-component system sensor histidine kinase YcbA